MVDYLVLEKKIKKKLAGLKSMYIFVLYKFKNKKTHTMKNLKLTKPQKELLLKMKDCGTGFYFQYDSEKKKHIHNKLKGFNTFLHNRELRIANRLAYMGLLKVEGIENKSIYFINK